MDSLKEDLEKKKNLEAFFFKYLILLLFYHSGKPRLRSILKVFSHKPEINFRIRSSCKSKHYDLFLLLYWPFVANKIKFLLSSSLASRSRVRPS